MRLIDADKLPYVNKVILVDDVDGDIIIKVAKEYTSYVNDETPTVKAIPIEWLEAQLDVFGDGFYDLRLVIKQWEKDNEIN